MSALSDRTHLVKTRPPHPGYQICGPGPKTGIGGRARDRAGPPAAASGASNTISCYDRRVRTEVP